MSLNVTGLQCLGLPSLFYCGGHGVMTWEKSRHRERMCGDLFAIAYSPCYLWCVRVTMFQGYRVNGTLWRGRPRPCFSHLSLARVYNAWQCIPWLLPSPYNSFTYNFHPHHLYRILPQEFFTCGDPTGHRDTVYSLLVWFANSCL